MSTGLYDELKAYVDAGLSIIPAQKNKVAAIAWTEFQERRPHDEELETWSTRFTAFSAVCGVISGNLECLDLDVYHDSTGKLHDEYMELVENTAPGLLARLVKHRTQSGGYHYLYRCPTISGSQKLAFDDKEGKEGVIETRGEKGYFMIPPTQGYNVIQGTLLAIPTITADERDILHSCARSFNKYVKQDIQRDAGRSFKRDGKLTPGDDFNARGDAYKLLEDAQWVSVHKKGETIYMRRPGKVSGISATFNYNGNGGLFVFSSNASPFDVNRYYSPFAIYAMIRHDGDFKKAAVDLYNQEYGDRQDEEDEKKTSEDSELQKEAAQKRSGGLMKAEMFMDENYSLRHNTISGMYEYRELVKRKGEGEYMTPWALIDDAVINSMKKKLIHAKIPYTTPEIIIYSNETYQYDPFAEYIDSLKPPEGDDYISRLAETVTTVPGFSGTWTAYLRKWMVAHIAQIIDCKPNHTALIFKGAQGVGKTTWLNQLCPPSLRNEYLIVSDIEANNKDHQIRLAENWLYNLDELENMQKQDIGHLKALFTISKIKVRRPYARTPEVLKRRASFVGSVNKDRFLTDDTGNRRFYVIEAVAFDTRHKVDIDRCWGEALELYRSGFVYWLELKDIEMVNALNESHRVIPLVEHLVVQHLEPTDVPGDWAFMTTTSIAEALQKRTDIKLNINDYFIRQLGSALQKHGFKKAAKKSDGNVRWGYNVKFSVATSNDDAF